MRDRVLGRTHRENLLHAHSMSVLPPLKSKPKRGTDLLPYEGAGYNDLPNELLGKISQELSGMDLVHGLLVSKAWHLGLRSGIERACLCIPRRRSCSWSKEICGLNGLCLRHLRLYGLASSPSDLFRGMHKSIHAFPNISKDLQSIAKGLVCLKTLVLEHIQLDSQGVQTLGEFEELKTLEINGCMMVDGTECDAVVLDHLQKLESLKLRSVECLRGLRGCDSCPLSVVLPDSLTALDIMDCGTAKNFLQNVPAHIKSNLRSLKYSLPLDPAVVHLTDSGQQVPWVMQYFCEQMQGMSSLTHLSLELVTRMTLPDEWMQMLSKRAEKRKQEFLSNLNALRSVSVKWSNCFLQFNSRRPEMSDQILDMVTLILDNSINLEEIDITLPLTGSALSTLRAIVFKPSLTTIRLDVRVTSGMENVSVEAMNLVAMLSHRTNLKNLELGLRGAKKDIRALDTLTVPDMLSIIQQSQNLESLNLEAWPGDMMVTLEPIPALQNLQALKLQSAPGLISLCGERMHGLRHLALSSSNISVGEFKILGEMPRLACLHLHQVEFQPNLKASDSACIGWDLAFPSLLEFSADTESSWLPDACLYSLPSRLQQLKLRVPAESQGALVQVLRRMVHLVWLDLSHNSWMDNKFLEGIAHMQHLRHLDVCHCPGVSGGCLGLVKELMSLRRVVINGVPDGLHDVLDWWDLEENFPRCDIQCSCPRLKAKCWWW